ncbi:MAG: HYR domain-containing protein, partial [bacterium]|nr:HYR domain-containing protein [bacterium]
GAEITWEPPIPTDNCGPPTLEGDYQPGDTFPVGLTDVVYTATDQSGNQTVDGFTITVLDTEDPEIPPMDDIEAPNDPGDCGAEITWEPPIPTDNCGPPTLEGDYQPGDTFPVGLTDVVYTATDQTGNQTVDGFTITVLDTEDPEIPPMDDIEAPNDPGDCGAEITWEPPIPTDNCGPP